MSGFAIAYDRYDRRAASSISSWARDYLRRVATADLACATCSVLLAVQRREAVLRANFRSLGLWARLRACRRICSYVRVPT